MAVETKTKIIDGEEFSVMQPYVEGHTINAIEAKVLNQVRSENIANNMRKAVKEAKENGTLDQVRKVLKEYDEQYEFTISTPGGAKMDPVEREANKVAREVIKANLAQNGRKLKDVDPDKLQAAVDNLIESNADIMKTARKRVDERKKVSDISVEGLGI